MRPARLPAWLPGSAARREAPGADPSRPAWWAARGLGLFAVVLDLVLVLVVTIQVSSDGLATAWPVIPLAVGIGAGYSLVAPEPGRSVPTWVPVAYLAFMGPAFGWMCFYGNMATLLFFVLYPVGWFLTGTRLHGALASAWITVCAGVGGYAAGGWQPQTIPEYVVEMALAFAISMLAGLWILGMIEVADERGRLLAELQDAQAALAAAHRAEGVAAERMRFSREIHDTLAQGLTSLVVLARTARAELADGEAGAAAERLGAIERTARENLAEARALVAATAPPTLAGQGLAAGLRRLVAAFAAETGCAARAEVPDEVPLDPPAQVAVLRAAQEALSNVRRHAHAHAVTLDVQVTDHHVALRVTDDGVGIDPLRAEGGYGLAGMRTRAEELGGMLEVGTGPGRVGTGVELTLPRRAQETVGVADVDDRAG